MLPCLFKKWYQVLSAVLRKSYQHVNINSKDKYGSTALHLAVERGDLDSVVVLLTFGADVNATDGNGDSPLIKAAAVSFYSFDSKSV